MAWPHEWITPEQFQATAGNPVAIYEALNQHLVGLNAQLAGVRQSKAVHSRDPNAKYADLINKFEELKAEHIDLNDRYNDQEHHSDTLQQQLPTSCLSLYVYIPLRSAASPTPCPAVYPCRRPSFPVAVAGCVALALPFVRGRLAECRQLGRGRALGCCAALTVPQYRVASPLVAGPCTATVQVVDSLRSDKQKLLAELTAMKGDAVDREAEEGDFQLLENEWNMIKDILDMKLARCVAPSLRNEPSRGERLVPQSAGRPESPHPPRSACSTLLRSALASCRVVSLPVEQENQILALNDELANYASKNAQLEDVQAELALTKQRLEAEQSRLADRKSQLSHSHHVTRETVEFLSEELDKKNAEVKDKTDELLEIKKQMTSRVLDLQRELMAKQEDIESMLSKSTKDRDNYVKHNKFLTDQVRKVADELAQLRRNRQDTRHMEQQVQVLQSRNEALEKDLERRLMDAATLRGDLKDREQGLSRDFRGQSDLIGLVHRHAELQLTREDIAMIHSRMCPFCRSKLLGDNTSAPDGLYRPLPSLPPSAPPALPAPPAAQAFPNHLPPAFPAPSPAHGASPVPYNNLSSSPHPAPSPPPPVYEDPVTPSLHHHETYLRQLQLQQQLQNHQDMLSNALSQPKAAGATQTPGVANADVQTRPSSYGPSSIHGQPVPGYPGLATLPPQPYPNVPARDAELEKSRLELEREREAEKQRERERLGQRKLTFPVRFANGTRTKVDAYLSNSVQELVQIVSNSIGVTQTIFFQVAHTVNSNTLLGHLDRFLEPSRTLADEAITPKCNLVYKAKHIKNVANWIDPEAQARFFEQIRYGITSGYTPCSEKLAVELASLHIQSEFGDFTARKRMGYFDQVGLDHYLPTTVSKHDYPYWQDRLFNLHQQRQGMIPKEARDTYVRMVRNYNPWWGMTFFDIKDKENKPFTAAVAEDGFFVLSTNKATLLQELKFQDLAGWEMCDQGVYLYKRNSTKKTLYSCTPGVSKEIVDLLNEYYLPLPLDWQQRIGIRVDNAEALRAKLPNPQLFDLPPLSEGIRLTSKAAWSIDRALDNNTPLEVLDFSGAQMDDKLMQTLASLIVAAMCYNPPDPTQWVENLQLTALDLSGNRFTAASLDDVTSMLKWFPKIVHLDVSD
eukprot:gene9183-1651_t